MPVTDKLPLPVFLIERVRLAVALTPMLPKERLPVRAMMRLGAMAMFNARDFLSVPPELVAVRFAVKLPAAAGVPEMSPVVGLIVRLPGRPVAPKLVALLLAVIW